MARRIFIFNPETDYALASGSKAYTAPARVRRIRKEKALFPSAFAQPGDAILIPDAPDAQSAAADPEIGVDADRLRRLAGEGLKVIGPRQLEEGKDEFAGFIATPWGWNPSLRHRLITTAPFLRGIPSEEEMEWLRNLSHRRTTIPFLMECRALTGPDFPLPQEILSAEECLGIFAATPDFFIKAPWSSSGRGVMRTRGLERRHVEPWVRGVIRDQGSVMVEHSFGKTIDCATEWWIKDGKARFLGYSLFEASGRGKYHSNIRRPQKEIASMIFRDAQADETTFLHTQGKALEKIVAPHYTGPVGIDMLVTPEGWVHPCVEINLRFTMGMVGLPFRHIADSPDTLY